MNLDLTDEQTEVLADELDAIIRNDRYPLSPRIQTLQASPRQVAAGADPRAAAAAEALRTAASYGGKTAPRRPLTENSRASRVRPMPKPFGVNIDRGGDHAVNLARYHEPVVSSIRA
jgi:hypothetical protein